MSPTSCRHAFVRLGLAAAIGCASLALAPAARAQIVNVQPLLGPLDEHGFSGQLDGSLTWKTGNVDFLLTSGSLLLKYQTGFHKLISSSSATLGIKNGDDFIERYFSHLRWQWSITDLLTWEVYGQGGADRFKAIALRALGGTGPRFELVPGPAVSAAVGISYMFEHEAYNGRDGWADKAETENAHRISLYFTGKFSVAPLVSLSNTTYYQPRLDQDPFTDWKLATDVSLAIELSKRLALVVGFWLYYDDPVPYDDDVKKLDTATNVKLSFKL